MGRLSDRGWRSTAVAAAAGAAGALAFPAPGWWWLAPLFLVPILLVCRSAPTGRRAARDGWAGGTAFFVAAHHWAIPSVSVFVLPLALLLGALWAPVGYVAWATMRPPLTPRRLALGLLLIPSAWVAAELVRSWDRLGGPWALLGATQWNNRPLLALASLGGVWLVSAAVVAIAVAITATLARDAPRFVRWAAAGSGLAIIVAALAYAGLRPGPAPGDGNEVRIAGVQPGAIDDATARFEAGERLTGSLGERVDLVVWGESSVGFDPQDRPDGMERIAELAADVGAPVLVNVDRRRTEGGIFKTSVLVGPEGTLAQYDKTRLVPFGEYIPLRQLLGWVTGLTTAAEVDRLRGERLEILTAPGAPELRLGPLICFESAFPDLARRHARTGVDLIVLQTATTTVEGTWAQAQHASLAAVRAVETGRPVVHAALSGVSAAFDATGRQRAWFEGDGTYVVRLPAAEGTTPYVRFGDWVPYAALVALAGAGFWALRRRVDSASVVVGRLATGASHGEGREGPAVHRGNPHRRHRRRSAAGGVPAPDR